MPKVTVIMNCRNGEAFVAAAITSVLEQTMDDFEIVFWDNLSTDRSAEIAQSYGERVLYFRGNIPLSLGEARNAALSEARGEYLAILDIDDVWLPEKLEVQVAVLDQRPEVGLVYADMLRLGKSGEPLCLWSAERQLHRGRVLEHLLTSCFISMSTIMVRRTVLDDVGMFDPRLEQTEDWDLYLRIAQRYPVDYVDAVLVKERLHYGNTSSQYDMVAEESCLLMEEWARRSPRHASICRGMIAVSRFKQAGVRAYQAYRAGRSSLAARNLARALGLVLQHPIPVLRTIARYGNAANRRVFGTRFS